MIWFQEKIDRDDADVEIVGEWNSPFSSASPNMIEIIMRIDGESRLLYSHNPSGAVHDEPNPDDVFQKYSSKTLKLLQKAREYPLDQLKLWRA
jgi:hypothetical protein